MSRVGNRPIDVPNGVEVSLGENNEVSVKGPKGELARSLSSEMEISMNDNVITVTRPTDGRTHRSMHGLTRSLLANMVEGVSSGFQKTLEIRGVGYRVQQSGKNLTIQIGYSNPVEVAPLPGIKLTADGTNRIIVEGIDKELVGRVAADIRKIRRPDPYLGKGIMYAGEQIRRKAGKAGKVGKK